MDVTSEETARMPIKIMLTNRGASPVVVCDVCGAWIDRADDGGYAWSQDRFESGTMCNMVFVHKGNCFRTYEAEHGAATCDMPLNVLFPYLVANLSIDWDAATRMAMHFSTP